MKLYKLIVIGLFIGIWLLKMVTVVSADDPPKSPDDSANQTSPTYQEGSFDPVPIQSSEAILDPTTASITQMELAADKKSLVPVTSPTQSSPPGSFAPGPLQLAEFSGNTLKLIPDSAQIANDMLLDHSTVGDIGTASSTQIKFENFELAFPNTWTRFDNNGGTGGQHLWGDVSCFPVESTGSWSGWPAAAGTDSVDPCLGTNYPSSVDSWLVYGPFSLADAKSAYLDFFYRIVSESNDDSFRWLASTNGTNYFGFQVSGTFTNGPFNNGYNFVSFDLTNVPTLGNLAGQSQVWIAFRFLSDADANVGQGPFIDAISLRKNTDARVNLTSESFDLNDFPNALWEGFDNDGNTNGDYYWDDVPCFSRSGSWSMWLANNGANALNPCSPSFNNYPNNAHSWLIHGPINLVGASEAWVDFYYRNTSETCCDPFFWGVSTNGNNFYGISQAGTYINGPYGNGYNLMRIYLSSVPTLGDLRGQPVVWLAFVFDSNATNTGQGPFIDDVNIAIERPQGPVSLFLPIIVKSDITLASVFVTNNTGGSLTYQVLGTPQGTISCNVPNGAQNYLCGPSFTPNSYNWQATAICGGKKGIRSYQPGPNYPKPFSCN